MWFKNLQLFRLKEPFTYSQDELETLLAAHRARPCAGQDAFTLGWHPPMGNLGDTLSLMANGCVLLCLRREERVLPAAVVNDMLAERIEQIETEQARTPNRREVREMRDALYQELLPRAFTRSNLTYAYLDPDRLWMLVDTASASRAEDLVSELRRTLGSLPVRPLSVNQAPSEIMTRWLQGQDLPKDLTLADQCELRDPDAEGGIVRCRRQDLAADEIQAHLKAGKRAVQVALEWEERVGVLLTDQPAFKRLRFGDFLLEQAAETGGDDPRARFDADFTLMTLELRRFIDRMLEVLGGASGD